ncbi:hypothetical protein QNH39_12840 [Neobacillus novalis]|uniref:Uncharacterized protein n=1 Tax=Neobacillus novalis TaxID=220687 RepID=A0AA95MV85_9BACI|nr:hypothetical protein [Neobacillus novalis]WHY88660.1 hypothetical protein QNH39_12840 [Neobacillus novalis]
MSRKNNWTVIFIYNLMLFFIFKISFKTLVEIAVAAETFPNSNYLMVLLSTIIGIGLLAIGVRRYIFISSKDEKERHKLRNIFLFTTPVPFIIYMGLMINTW